MLRSEVHCKNCKHVSRTYDPYLDLSLPLASARKVTIYDCLDSHFKEEIAESYTCEKCKKVDKVKLIISICKTSRILAIHLKRFKYTL